MTPRDAGNPEYLAQGGAQQRHNVDGLIASAVDLFHVANYPRWRGPSPPAVSPERYEVAAMTTRMSTGIGKGPDGATTAKAAIVPALDKLGVKPDLVICYCSPVYDYHQVLPVLQQVTDGVPLIGCSSAGEFTEAEVASGSVAVALIASNTIKFDVSAQQGLKADSLTCVRAAARRLSTDVPGYPNRNYLVYHDGLAGCGEETILAMIDALGVSNRVFGGGASDDQHAQRTVVFCNGEVLRDAVALCSMASTRYLPTTVKHGHSVLSPVLTITRAQGNVLYEVDGRPAWDLWKEQCTHSARELLNLDVNTLTSPEDIFRVLGAFELGLQVGADYKMRAPQSKNPDGSLNFACTIYAGSKFRIMQTCKSQQIDSPRAAAKKLMAECGGKKPAGALVFDCSARQMILGDEFPQSVEAMRAELSSVPMLGYEAYGEICLRENDVSGFHNTTTAMTLFPA